VDYLSDQQFPVEQVTIVGVDLMQVERVTGRLTWPKVVGGGILTGAWLGIFIGLVLGFFAPNPWSALLTGLIAGVIFGLISSAVPYAMARGTRDFSSTMQLVAGRYDVLCDPQNAEKALDLIAAARACRSGHRRPSPQVTIGYARAGIVANHAGVALRFARGRFP
jgi:hypothetical protein